MGSGEVEGSKMPFWVMLSIREMRMTRGDQPSLSDLHLLTE